MDSQGFEPYLDVAFDCFGPARLMPVPTGRSVRSRGIYRVTMAVLRDYLERRTPAERDAVLGGNAQRVWKRAFDVRVRARVASGFSRKAA